MVEKKIANAMGGKTARACDSCLHKRASWYCAADDAFLCHRCDVTVHSANQLAGRHERVRLETGRHVAEDVFAPAWHRGFTRKARTPRHNKKHISEKENIQKKFLNPLPFVPEIVNEEAASPDENEAELLYRVPIFDPFAAELCNEVGIEISEERTKSAMKIEGRKVADDYNGCVNEGICELDDMDLADFAADVENLLGRGFDEDSCDIKELGLLDCKEEDVASMDAFFEGRITKIKDEEEMEGVRVYNLDDPVVDMTRESGSFDWSFDYDESDQVGAEAEEERKEVMAIQERRMSDNLCEEEMRRKISLTLDYEAVITAWASQGSPWTTGNRPELNPDDCWPSWMGGGRTNVPHDPSGGQVGRGGDGGREARVSRYKEKRRTRLFSKKIRYEVRKLNAEKRPRMKGRFVKRTSFVGTAFPYLN